MPISTSVCPTETLYRDHHSWLKQWFGSRLGCSHRAADLAQDTFVRVLARREAVRRETLNKPRSFLRVIASGLLVDHYRRRSLDQAYFEALAAMPGMTEISPEEREILLETLDRIDSALEALPQAVRKAFLLSQLEGRSYADIADELTVSVRTVKRYMQQGFGKCLTALL